MGKEKSLDTALVDKAIIFATNAHKGIERRGKGFPYIIHPLEVMSIVASLTNKPELLAAAVLHDTVEDTDVTFEDIEREFGKEVREIVENESDIVIPNATEEESWVARKQAAIERLATAPRDSQIVALGDKLSNMRQIYQDYKTIGDKIWERFHVKDKKLHEWHYRGLVESLKSLDGNFAYREFNYLVNKVFKEDK